MNHVMVDLVKKTIPEIDLKLSNKIVECIKDVTNISDVERATIMYIMDIYICSYEAIENFRKYLSTSYYKQIDGKKYSHILNPHTGYGLEHLSQVTVIARDGMSADSLATALSVLGPKKSRELGFLKVEEGTRAFFLTQEDEKQILKILE